MKQTCKQCGKEFELTEGEIKFYKDKGLSLPKRCAQCRESNKKENNAKKSGKKWGAAAAAVIAAVGLMAGHSAVNHDTAAPVQQSVQQEISVQSAEQENIAQPAAEAVQPAETAEDAYVQEYYFRNKNTRDSHFKKHGGEFGGAYVTPQEYETCADKAAHSDKALHKTEKEDGDDVYYIEDTNEFVVVSTDGYIRTYFKPDAGRRYFDRQ